MINRAWDAAAADEWLPRRLRLQWGSSDGGGDSAPSTGGGDWGSSGNFDASSFNAGGDTSAWAGTAYDASISGTGMGGGGDWGSFAATNYAGLDAPNPVYTDVAGPNPGVTTGGGDWGSAGTYSAAGTGGGVGGAFYGSGGGGGGNYYGSSDPGAYYGGGGGGGYYGGGGGGGTFGGWGAGPGSTVGGSNYAGSVGAGISGPDFSDSAGSGPGAGGGHAGGPASYSEGPDTSDTPSGMDLAADTPSSDMPSGMDLAADQPSQPSSDQPSEPGGAPPGDDPNAGIPESGPPAAPEGGGGRGPSGPSSFGPQTVEDGGGKAGPVGTFGVDVPTDPSFYGDGTPPAAPDIADYGGAPYADMGPQTAPDTSGPTYSGEPDTTPTGDFPVSSTLAQALNELSQTTQQALTQQYDPSPISLADVRGAVFGPMEPGSRSVFNAPFWSTPSWANNPPPSKANENLSSWWSNLDPLDPATYAFPGPEPGSLRSALERDAMGRNILSAYDFLANMGANLNPNDYGNQQSLNQYITENEAPPQIQSDIPEQVAGPGLQSFDPAGYVDFGDAGLGAAPSGAQQVDEAGFAPSGAPTLSFAPDEIGFQPGDIGPMGDLGTWGDAATAGVIGQVGTQSGFAPSNFSGAQQVDEGGFMPSGPFADMLPAGGPAYPTSPDTAQTPGAQPQDEPGYPANAIETAAPEAPADAKDAAANAAADAAARGGDPTDQAVAARDAAINNGATPEQADAIAGAVHDAASNQGALAGRDVVGDRGDPGAQRGADVIGIGPAGKTAAPPGLLFEMLNSPQVASFYGAYNPQNIINSAIQNALLQPAQPNQPLVTLGDIRGAVYGTQPGQFNAPPSVAPTSVAPPAEPAQPAPAPPEAQPAAPPPPEAQPAPQSLLELAGVPPAATTTPGINIPSAFQPPPGISRPGQFTPIPRDQMSTPGEEGRIAVEQGGYNTGHADDPSRDAVPGSRGGRNDDLPPLSWTAENQRQLETRVAEIKAMPTVAQQRAAVAGMPAWMAKELSRQPDQMVYPGNQPADMRGRPTAGQLGIRPTFETRGLPWERVDAEYMARINALHAAMPVELQPYFVMSDGYRSYLHQSNITSRGIHPAARAGNSRHQLGNAMDFLGYGTGNMYGRALAWARANAARFGLYPLPGDIPHIEIRDQNAHYGPEVTQRIAETGWTPARSLPGREPVIRPPADIPNVARNVPLPRPAPDRPPADIPPAPPQTALPPEAPSTVTPIAPVETPTTPARAGRPDVVMAQRLAEGIARSSARPDSQAAGQALANRVAGELARAGFPADVAVRVILEGIRQGTREAGYNPDATIMGVSIAARLQEMANTAMQNYRPVARGEVQGPPSPRGLAGGGHVEKGEVVTVGEEGPETFVPDEAGTVLPYIPQASATSETAGRWPRLALPGAAPGTIKHIGLGGYIQNQNRTAQYPSGLLEMLDAGALRINPNWDRMLADPRYQAMGRARIEDRRNDPYY